MPGYQVEILPEDRRGHRLVGTLPANGQINLNPAEPCLLGERKLTCTLSRLFGTTLSHAALLYSAWSHNACPVLKATSKEGRPGGP